MSKAIVFTHLDERDRLSDPNCFDDFEERRLSFFKHCLQCSNIGVVFVYSSYGIQAYIDALLAGNGGAIPLDVLDGEQRIYDALQLVVDNAAADIATRRRGFRRSHGPKFVFVGVRELACHLGRLHRTDENLVRSLAAGDRFTYDSPKYVEAIIRIGRGHYYPDETIVRIDADVEVNEEAIDRLIREADAMRQTGRTMWWFSGTYKGNFPGDGVNEHAVRQHWLVDPETWDDPMTFRLIPGAESFLVDLAELGATQLVPQAAAQLSIRAGHADPAHDPRLSAAAKDLIERRGFSKNRGKPQVISGAGLVASQAAIHRLPPFTNARSMVVWIDDHLKRLLHEAIGDIGPARVERLMDAQFKQDRYPIRLTQKDVDWASNVYFKRLLAGCMMEATIKTSSGKPGPLAERVAAVVDHQAPFSKEDEQELRLALVQAACGRFKEVMSIWRTTDYGNAILRHWAVNFEDCDSLAADVADIGVSYVFLCFNWPKHTHAMWTLNPQEAYWLFALPREAPPRARLPKEAVATV